MLLDSDMAQVVGLRQQIADAQAWRETLQRQLAVCDENIMWLTVRLMDAERAVIEANR